MSVMDSDTGRASEEARRELRRSRWRLFWITLAGCYFGFVVGGWGWLIAGFCFGAVAVGVFLYVLIGRQIILLAELHQRAADRRELDESLERWFKW